MEKGIGEILLEAFRSSDSCGQWIVYVLWVGSLVACCIIASKGIFVCDVRKKCAEFKRNFMACNGSPLEMVQRFPVSEDSYDNPLNELCKSGIRSLLVILGIREFEQRDFFRHGRLPRRLSGDEIEKIKAGMNRIANDKVRELEARLTVLNSIVSLAPLCGLLGTVWGVMATFIGIAQQGQPDIATVAPGISSALLTTVAGLIVSIPCLFCSNLIHAAVDNVCVDMEDFINDFITSLKLEDIAESETSSKSAASAGNVPPVVVSVQPVCGGMSTPGSAGEKPVHASTMSAHQATYQTPRPAASAQPVQAAATVQPQPAPYVPKGVPQRPSAAPAQPFAGQPQVAPISGVQQTFVLQDEDDD